MFVELEISKPSVFGLSSGALRERPEKLAYLQFVMEMWFFGLLLDLSPLTLRLLQLRNLNSCPFKERKSP